MRNITSGLKSCHTQATWPVAFVSFYKNPHKSKEVKTVSRCTAADVTLSPSGGTGAASTDGTTLHW